MSRPDNTFALPNQLRLAKVTRNAFTLDVPAAVSLEDVMDPTYLSACLGRHFEITPMARIEVVAAKTWWAELLVVAVNKDAKRVWTKIINKPITLDYDATAGASKYVIAAGAHGRYVARLGNKTIKDFDTKIEAEAWINSKRQAA